MKKKIYKIMGVALIVVLLGSLTIGLAVPAAADPGTLKWSKIALPKVGAAGDYQLIPGTDVGSIAVSPEGEALFAAASNSYATLGVNAPSAATWSTTESHSGSCSALLDFDDVHIYVDITPLGETTGTDFSTAAAADFGFWYYQTAEPNFGPQLELKFEDPGSAAYIDITFMLQTNTVLNTWTQVDLSSTFGAIGSWDGTTFNLLADLAAAQTLMGTATYDDYVLTKVRVELYDDPALDRTCYIDDVIIDGATYDMAGLLLFKSTDGGYGWKAMEGFDTVVDIVVSPEYADDSTVFVASEDYVYQSVDGGKNFVQMTRVWTKTITDLDVAMDGKGRLAIMVGTSSAGAETGEVYVLSTKTGMTWLAQEIGTDWDVLAVGFSPFFADDEGIAAVVTTDDAPGLTSVRFAFAYTATGGGWGVDYGDASITDAWGDDFDSSHARIAFPDDFDAAGIGNNVCFVGIYSGSDTDPDFMDGDVYKIVLKSTSSAIDLDIRGVITTLLPTSTNIVSIDVCGDAEDASILVGTNYCSLVSTPAYFLVYRSDDGGETWIPSGTKSPTGGDVVSAPVIFEAAWTQVLMSPEFLSDEIAYAATCGTDTSAFSRSKDSGATWDQISLMDYGDKVDGYAVTNLNAKGYNADDTLHIVTQVAGSEGAVWKRTNNGLTWERIWSYANPGVTSVIKKIYLTGEETIFAVDFAAGYMWRSSDNGATWPKKITTKDDLEEVCVVSPTTIYTGHPSGGLWWSTKSGAAWKKPVASEITGTVGGIAVKGDTVLAGNSSGQVFISSDAGETFERIGVTDPGTSGTAACAMFDGDYDTNHYIYAPVMALPPSGGPADTGVYRCEVDVDDPDASEWVRIDEFGEGYDYTTVIAGPAGMLPGNILYGFDLAAVVKGDVAGGLWRCVNPAAPVPYPYFEKENKGLATGDVIYIAGFDVFPTVAFGLNWAAANYYEQVVTFTDTLATGVPLTDPGDAATGVGLLPAGKVYPKVGLAWEEMAGATSYQWQIAIDSGFKSVVDSGYTTSLVSDTLTLSPNKTYYWRARVANENTALDLIGAPLISPWAETWEFKTAIGATMARPDLEAPWAGEPDVSLSPTFEWSGIEWAETYEFELSTGSSTTAGGYFTDVLVGLTGTNALVSTAWKCDIALDYEARYYWHVKAFGVDTETPWSDVGTFTTMAVPPEPVEPGPPVVIPPVEEITPIWLWVIIGIGAALMIAVIILIVTTRRVP